MASNKNSAQSHPVSVKAAPDSRGPGIAAPTAVVPSAQPVCEPCSGVQLNWRRAPGHAELVQGSNRKEEREGRQVTITRYRCDRCGQIWDYENDKANLHAGWSMLRPRGPRA